MFYYFLDAETIQRWKLFKGGNYMGKYSTYSFLKLQNLIDFNQDLQKRKEKKLSSDKAEKAVLKP